MPLSSVVGAQSIVRPGVCTSSTRPASPYDGQVIYETDTDKIAVYDSTAWVYKTGASAPTAPALVLIKSQTIGTTVSSVEVTDAFSSTYENYRVVMSGVDYSAGGYTTKLTFGSTSTGYYGSWYYDNYDAAGTGTLRSNNAAFLYCAQADTENGGSMVMDVYGPNVARRTTVSGQGYGGATSFWFSGAVFNTTQYTSFTITPTTVTMTGGTIRVYGYANS